MKNRCCNEAFLALVALVTAGVAGANVCAQDAVPAATLLFPYVAVSVGADGAPDPSGQTTITRVTNVSPEAVIVHFTVWDVAGVPRFTFDEVLAGYDVLQVNWRDMLSGRGDLFDSSRQDFTATLPFTRDPYEWGPDGRGQDGGLATPENRSAVTAAQCPGPPPYGSLSELAPTIRNLLHGAIVSRQHLGACQPDPWITLRSDKRPFGATMPASPLFFYVTADVVRSCTTLTPADASYWATVASAENVLVGDVIHLNATANTSEMMTAVHIEAAREGEPRPASGFYGEKAGVATDREPLPTAFALNFANYAYHGMTSSVLLWKNFTELDAVDDPATGVWGRPSDCGSYLYYAWDMDERSLSLSCPGICEYVPGEEPNQFPFATQKVPLTSEYFDLPDVYGWMLIVLPPSYGADYVDRTPDGQGFLQRPYMGWAGVQLDYGSYSAGSQAASMGNALCDPSQALPRLANNSGTTRKAGFCARDQVPAATLLFPYVTVDLGSDGAPDPQGQTTITRIVNAAPEAAVVHLVAWDAIGTPQVDFDEILSGYDVVQINWRDYLEGRFDLFDTSTDPFRATSPKTRDPYEWGPDSRELAHRGYGLTTPQNRDVVEEQCQTVPPYGNRSDLEEIILGRMNGVLVAREHAGCGETWAPRGDKTPFGGEITKSPTFFYVTADVVKACNLEFPTDALYWKAYASTANVLLGDVIYLDASANTSEMVPAVHIEAASEPAGGPSVFGFYEERSGAETNREPLATAFMLDYGNDPASGITSNVIFWKNFTELDVPDDVEAGTFGKVVDCGSHVYYAFDMDGRSLSRNPLGCEWGPCGRDPNQLPLATQKVPLTTTYFDLPAAYGFVLIVLPPSYGPTFVDPTPDDGGYLSRPYMGWAGVQSVFGTYSAGEEAITVGNALCFPGQVLPGLGASRGPQSVRRHLGAR